MDTVTVYTVQYWNQLEFYLSTTWHSYSEHRTLLDRVKAYRVTNLAQLECSHYITRHSYIVYGTVLNTVTVYTIQFWTQLQCIQTHQTQLHCNQYSTSHSVQCSHYSTTHSYNVPSTVLGKVTVFTEKCWPLLQYTQLLYNYSVSNTVLGTATVLAVHYWRNITVYTVNVFAHLSCSQYNTVHNYNVQTTVLEIFIG